jgi:phospholipase C
MVAMKIHTVLASRSVHRNIRSVLCASAASLMVCSSVGLAKDADGSHDADITTPIRHAVIINPENRTFDNYFGTYPHAANIRGEQSGLGVPAPRAGGKMIEVAKVRITAAGRDALAAEGW